MKYYKVKVYDIEHNEKNRMRFIDDIIVRKNFFDIEEIVTGNIIRTKTRKELKDIKKCRNDYIYNAFNHDLVVVKDSINEDNLVTSEECSLYIDNFENSKINKLFNIMNEHEKQKIKD